MLQMQLWMAIALIVLESFAFAFFTEAWTVPVLVSVMALGALITEGRIPLSPSRRFVAALILAIPFTLQWAVAPYEPQHLRVFILYSLAFSGGQYGLALQASYVWVKPREEPWSWGFPVCGVCVLLAAGDVQTNGMQNIIFQIVVLLFILLVVGFFSYARIDLRQPHRKIARGRLTLSALTLLMTFTLAVAGSRWLEHSWSTLEKMYTEWMFRGGTSGGAGFSRQARLGSVSDQPSPEDQFPALRVRSVEEPGYLRGAAYDQYNAGSWSNQASRRPILPAASVVPNLVPVGDGPLYPLPGPGSLKQPPPRGAWRSVEVWPTGTAVGGVFAPLEATWIGVGLPEIEQDLHGICYASDLLPESNFVSYVPGDFGSLVRGGVEQIPNSPNRSHAGETNLQSKGTTLFQSNTQHIAGFPEKSEKTLLDVPEDIDPKVKRLSGIIFQECVNTEQKLDAVTGWFRKNYHYQLGIKIPQGQDPLTYFLTRGPAAHCEYFAAGTVILLRLAGVPCRYVTGFVVTEYNYLGGYWLARNKDAHAWAEAWVPDRGWVIVESTPGSGVPHSTPGIQPRHLWDDLLMRTQMLRNLLSQGTWRGAWRAFCVVLGMLFLTPHGWFMLAGIGVWSFIRFRRYFRFSFRTRSDPVAAEFQRLLQDFERALEKGGWKRASSETLNQFAERLEMSGIPAWQPAVEWIRQYALVRYRDDSRQDMLIQLKDEFRKIVLPGPGKS